MAIQIIHGDDQLLPEITTPILNPVEAEVHFTFRLPKQTPNIELRGRLMGPRSVFASTVEIAHPLRPLPRAEHDASSTITGRVIIPEPSFWSPGSPFLYEGPIELWGDGKQLVQLLVSQGLRTLQFQSGGLRWNGKQVSIQGRSIRAVSNPEVLAWRREGVNTWLISAGQAATEFCRLADRLGFFVFLRLSSPADLNCCVTLGEHASCLGWILARELMEQDCGQCLRETVMASRKQIVGVDLRHDKQHTNIAGIHFVYVQRGLSVEPGQLPLLYETANGIKDLWPGEAGVFGFIEETS